MILLEKGKNVNDKGYGKCNRCESLVVAERSELSVQPGEIFGLIKRNLLLEPVLSAIKEVLPST